MTIFLDDDASVQSGKRFQSQYFNSCVAQNSRDDVLGNVLIHVIGAAEVSNAMQSDLHQVGEVPGQLDNVHTPPGLVHQELKLGQVATVRGLWEESLYCPLVHVTKQVLFVPDVIPPSNFQMF